MAAQFRLNSSRVHTTKCIQSIIYGLRQDVGYEWSLDMRSTSAPWHESAYPAEHHEARREDTEDLHKAEGKA